MSDLNVSPLHQQRTILAYVVTRILDTPFWAIYNLLPFILYKDLQANPTQLAVIITLKPLVSLLSMYWSAAVNQRRDRLVSNIMWGRWLSYLPFFFFPFIQNSWFFIAVFALYMMFAVGMMPAWMELLRLNVPEKSRERVFSYSQAFGYMGGGLLPFLFGWMLDEFFQAWRWIFPISAFVALLACFFQVRILIPSKSDNKSSPPLPFSFKQQLVDPWSNAWKLLLQRPDFRRFQIGFMVIGCGLMIMQPALPMFYVDVLHLSYTELAVALTFCKGLGFALASPLWAKWINRFNLYQFSSWVSALGCLFPICLIFSQVHLMWLYLAYLSYGIMQAGNELTWNMSGPIFSQNEDSSAFSSVNIIAVGIRGCLIPLLGSLLCTLFSSSFVLILGAGLCLLATFCLSAYSRQDLKTHQSY
jgi:MFS family permease